MKHFAIILACSIGMNLPTQTLGQDEEQSFYISTALIQENQSLSTSSSSRFTHHLNALETSFAKPPSQHEMAFTTSSLSPSHFETSFDFGRFANLAAGFKVAQNFRVEAEVAYLQHDVDVGRAFQLENQDLGNGQDSSLAILLREEDVRELDLASILSGGVGKVETKATFANGFWDVPLQQGRLTPYVGAGLGMAQVDMEYAPAGIQLINQTQTVLAYQMMVGASYTLSHTSNMVLGARYRGMGSGADLATSLLPPEFEVEGQGFVGEIGFRRDF